jgi:hypothetical protein
VVDRIDFQMVQPPGWVHIPIGENAKAVADDFARRASRALPAEQRAAGLKLLIEYLDQTIEQATQAGSQDLFFPGETLDGAAIPISIVAAFAPSSSSPVGGSKMEALTAFSARSSTSEVKNIGGEPAIRQFIDLPAQLNEDGKAIAPANRRVTYLVWTPTEKPRLMMFVGTIIRLDSEDAQDLVEALEFLFDTIMTTVRFTGAPAAVDAAEEQSA